MTIIHTIAHRAPPSGFFVGRFAIPGHGPDILRGPFDEIAAAVFRSPEATVYQFSALAEAWSPMRDLREDYVVPWVERTAPMPPFAPHPSTLARILELIPIAEVDGQRLATPTFERVVSAATLHSFHIVWDSNGVVVNAWAEIPHAMPWIDWTIIAQRRDSQPVRVNLTWPWHSRAILSGFGEAAIRSVLLITDMELDPAEELAIENARNGPWLGLPTEWRGTLLGQPVVRSQSGLLDRAALSWQGSWSGRENPNAPGVDNAFGATWTAPLWPSSGGANPSALRTLYSEATDYGFRPCHFLQREDARPLRIARDGDHATLHKGQPHGLSDAILLGIGPQFRSQDNDTFDHEHRSVAPLAIAALLTGELGLLHLCESYLGQEMLERSFLSKWPQAGRGQGLPWIAATTLRKVLEGDPKRVEFTVGYDDERWRQYLSARRSGPAITVGGLYTRGSPWVVDGVERPYSDPYEQGILAVALWLSMGDDPQRIDAAWSHAISLPTGLWWDAGGRAHAAYNQRWWDGYWPHNVEVGMPINDDLRPAGDAMGTWIGAGLLALLSIAERIRELWPEDQRPRHPWLRVAAAALRDFELQVGALPPGEQFAAAHRSMAGAAPELVARYT